MTHQLFPRSPQRKTQAEILLAAEITMAESRRTS